MNTHTPGPWINWSNQIVDQKHDPVCDLYGRDTDKPYRGAPEADANARLITASPDMLSALRLALERLEHHTFQTETLADTKALLSIRAAINQATQP